MVLVMVLVMVLMMVLTYTHNKSYNKPHSKSYNNFYNSFYNSSYNNKKSGARLLKALRRSSGRGGSSSDRGGSGGRSDRGGSGGRTLYESDSSFYEGESSFSFFEGSTPGLEERMVVEMMKNTLKLGTARRTQSLNLKGIYAGKTGTTNDHKDGWFVALSPQYTFVTWLGESEYTKRKKMKLTGATGAVPIWMSLIESMESQGLYSKEDWPTRGLKPITLLGPQGEEATLLLKPTSTFDSDSTSDSTSTSDSDSEILSLLLSKLYGGH